MINISIRSTDVYDDYSYTHSALQKYEKREEQR